MVNEEFNRISFTIDNTTSRISYSAILTRTPQNQYILSYENNTRNIDKELPPASLEALLSLMSGNVDFNQASIDQVRAQAQLIPAVILGDAGMRDLQVILTSFYVSPNTQTYTSVMEVERLFSIQHASTNVGRHDLTYARVLHAYRDTLVALNPALAQRVTADANRQSTITLSREQQRVLLGIGN